MKQIECERPQALTVHIIADNYSMHKHTKVQAVALKRHKRFEMHGMSTSSSWLNLVEQFFADVTQDCVRAGSFTGLQELTEAITSVLGRAQQGTPAIQVESKSGKEILAKIQWAR